MRLTAICGGAAVALSAVPAAAIKAAAPDGAAIFAEVCAACHGPAGEGAPGLAPPLADPPLWSALGPAAPRFVAGVVISGLSGTIQSQGQGYYGLAMPSQAHLSDAELAAVGSYVLSSFGASTVSVRPEDVAAARAAPPSHPALMAMRGGGGI